MLLPLLSLALLLLVNQGANGQSCSSGVTNGQCVNGACPTGYTCGQGNLCCKNSSCADENPSCQTWAKNGFCTNPYFTPDDKKMCAKTCGLC